MTERLAEYTTVHSTMARARVPVAVSELHGGICGLLCAGGASAVPAWVEESDLQAVWEAFGGLVSER